MYQTGKSQEAEVGTIPKLNLPLTLSSRFFFIKICLYICYPFLFGRRIAAEWLARRTLKSQVPGSIPGSGKAHVEWKGYSITKQKPSSARGSFVSFSANSKLAPILGHARRFIRRLRHILNIVHELIIRCEEGNKIRLGIDQGWAGVDPHVLEYLK